MSRELRPYRLVMQERVETEVSVWYSSSIISADAIQCKQCVAYPRHNAFAVDLSEPDRQQRRFSLSDGRTGIKAAGHHRDGYDLDIAQHSGERSVCKLCPRREGMILRATRRRTG